MSLLARPSYHLPACPLCSSIKFADHPIWRFAHSTSAKRGRQTYSFTGCKHAMEVGRQAALFSDPEEWKAIEGEWAHACEVMFAQRTENWTKEEAERFRKGLEPEKHFIPGAVEELKLESPDKPEEPLPF